MPMIYKSLVALSTSESGVEPLTCADVKRHIRVADDDVADDGLIASYIEVARRQIEADTMRSIVNKTYQLRMDELPTCDDLELPVPHVVNTTSVTVQYTPTTGGALATFASTNYTVDAEAVPGYIRLKENSSWPDANVEPNSVLVTFQAGLCGSTTDAEADRAKIDPRIKQAVRVLVDEYFCDRGPEGTPTNMAYHRLIRGLKWAGYR